MRLEWLDTHQPAATSDLAAIGVVHQRLSPDPQTYQADLDALATARGYVEQDVVELSPGTPNLDGICAKFADEHLHTDDEVRYVLQGEGIFDLRSRDDRWIRVVVDAGDLIVVPANLHHRFFLTETKHIRCVRLFKDRGGWVPHYRDQASP
jgi:1,2-dihydroxy-3-keto-5-methylthiopentene dioxygenase